MAEQFQTLIARTAQAEEGPTVTCQHCNETQKLVEFFKFCEYCHKPLQAEADDVT